MARNRMIKPEFWSDEKLISVSLESRLLFIGIWNFADDYGFTLNSIRQITGNVFPLDTSVTEKLVKVWLYQLIATSLIIPVRYRDKELLFVKGWAKHQTVPNPSKRRYVEEADWERVTKEALESNESLISVSLESNSPKNKEQRTKNKEKEKDQRDIVSQQFEDCWKAFGNYGTKKKAKEYWCKLADEDRDSIKERIPIYLKHLERTGFSQKAFEGWINPKNRIWETTYENSPERQTFSSGNDLL